MDLPINIYIVDDDSDDIDFFHQAIASINISIQCYSALNGEIGLRQLYTKVVPRPDCIFLDLNMPRINGKEFLERIKEDEEMNAIPVVIYSTSRHEKDKDEYLRLGAIDFLVKPTRLSDLQQMLKESLSKILK